MVIINPVIVISHLNLLFKPLSAKKSSKVNSDSIPARASPSLIISQIQSVVVSLSDRNVFSACI